MNREADRIKGLGVMEVASITGHKSLSMLKRYTHIEAEKLAQKLGQTDFPLKITPIIFNTKKCPHLGGLELGRGWKP